MQSSILISETSNAIIHHIHPSSFLKHLKLSSILISETSNTIIHLHFWNIKRNHPSSFLKHTMQPSNTIIHPHFWNIKRNHPFLFLTHPMQSSYTIINPHFWNIQCNHPSLFLKPPMQSSILISETFIHPHFWSIQRNHPSSFLCWSCCEPCRLLLLLLLPAFGFVDAGASWAAGCLLWPPWWDINALSIKTCSISLVFEILLRSFSVSWRATSKHFCSTISNWVWLPNSCNPSIPYESTSLAIRYITSISNIRYSTHIPLHILAKKSFPFFDWNRTPESGTLLGTVERRDSRPGLLNLLTYTKWKENKNNQIQYKIQWGKRPTKTLNKIQWKLSLKKKKKKKEKSNSSRQSRWWSDA